MPLRQPFVRTVRGRRARFAAAVAVLALLGAGESGSAAAATATKPAAKPATVGARAGGVALPATPWFPAWIDAIPRWEPETGCEPAAKPGPVAVTAMLRATYGAIGSNIVRACTGSDSGHEEGRAIDWMVSVRKPAQKELGDAFVRWLLADDSYGNHYAAARRLGIMYVIWDSKIFSIYNAGSGWREYSGCLTKRLAVTDDTACHRDHVHLSFSWAGARKQTSWWTLADTPVCPRLAALPTPLGRTGRPTGVAVGVATTTVLDTVGGRGTPTAGVPCSTDRTGGVIDVKVSGVGAVPAGAGEVRMTVKLTAAPGTPATISVVSPRASTGPAGMAPVRALAGTTATGVWDVPVSAPGHILLRVTPAGTQVSATVSAVRLVKR
jgi:hypothetical protein